MAMGQPNDSNTPMGACVVMFKRRRGMDTERGIAVYRDVSNPDFIIDMQGNIVGPPVYDYTMLHHEGTFFFVPEK